MPRRRVLIEFFEDRPGETSLAAAEVVLRGLLQLDLLQDWPPVSLLTSEETGNVGISMATGGSASTYVVSTEIDETQQAEIRSNPQVVGLWDDPQIAPFPIDCEPNAPKGSALDVAQYLGANVIWATGCRAAGVKIGIVDTGVDGSDARLRYAQDGWTPPGQPGPGTSGPGGHGSMTAFDAISMAPDAEIYDIRALTAPGGVPALLSAALAGFQWAINRHRLDGTPQVLSNSWGIFQESWGPSYARDPAHPFTRKVLEAIREGILVCFAAGNCGSFCPSSRCGLDVGPGASIWGANSHPEVITFGVVNLHEEWIGYSSQGPGAIGALKPDLCALSHFQGYTPSDSGTSAACPVGAGILALMACKTGGAPLRQGRAQAILQLTAKDILSPGWDACSGYGILQGLAAWQQV